MKFKLGVWKQNVTTSLRNLSQRIAPKTRIIVKVSQTLNRFVKNTKKNKHCVWTVELLMCCEVQLIFKITQ